MLRQIVARTSIVAKAKRSKAADRKAVTQRTEDGLPVHSFRSLLADLATVTRNTMAMAASPDADLSAIHAGAGTRSRTARCERQVIASKRDPQLSNPRVASNSYVCAIR